MRTNAASDKGAKSLGACFLLIISFAGAFALSGGGYNEVHLINRQVITTPDQAPSLAEVGRVARLEDFLGTKNRHKDIGVDLLLLAAERGEWRDALSQRQITTIGQLRVSGSHAHIVRLLSICCAADARPLGIGVSKESAREFSTGDWVRATGRVEFVNENGHFSLRLVQAELTKTDAPENVILY
jgi:hypothetical protein